MALAYILGIDPGLYGALALYDVSTGHTTVYDMPVTDGRVDPYCLADIVRQCVSHHEIHAAVELVGSMPRQKGAFNFGLSTGVIHGVLGALAIPFTLVSPVVWKSAVGLRRSINETQEQNKTRARALAVKLFPEMAWQFKRIKDDGRAEACLIARYFALRIPQGV